MTFIRNRVRAMYLTHHIKMNRQHPECARLWHFPAAMLGFFVSWAFSVIVVQKSLNWRNTYGRRKGKGG